MKTAGGSRLRALAVTGVCLLALAGVWAAVRPGSLRPLPSAEPPGKEAGLSSYHAPAEGEYVEDPFCGGCHGTPPHARGSFRAMLNHHVTRLHCLVCHGQDFLARGDLRLEQGVVRPVRATGPPDRALEEEWRETALETGPCFPAGPGCSDCHRRDGLLDLRSLGYEPQRAERLEMVEDFLTRSPAERWFFPSLP